MSEMQVEPAPEPAPARRPRRAPVAAVVPPVEVVAEPPAAAPAPAADEVAPVAPPVELAPQPAPAVEPPHAPARRAPRQPTAIAALDLALPRVRTAEIMAELDRRQRRAKALLAQRERVIAEMDAIEAALDAIGE